MSGVKKSLTRKFGPLPAWAWALIAGVGLLWYRNRTAGASSQSAASGAGPDLGTYGPYGQDPYGIAGGGAGNGSGSGDGGGMGTTTGGVTTDPGPPQIIVNPPGGTGGRDGTGSVRRNKRQKKLKAQHHQSGKKNENGRHRSHSHVKPGHSGTRAHGADHHKSRHTHARNNGRHGEHHTDHHTDHHSGHHRHHR